MKIIYVDCLDGRDNKKDGLSLDDGTWAKRFRLMADSTWLREGHPFFPPFVSKEWMAVMGLVVRISRLGKTIATRFAYRYYDAVAVGLSFVKMSEYDNKTYLEQDDLNWNVDFSTAIGSFQLLSGSTEKFSPEVKLGDQTINSQQEIEKEDINGVIGGLSRYLSFRQGDLLFLGLSALPLLMKTNVHVCGFLNGSKGIDFNIK